MKGIEAWGDYARRNKVSVGNGERGKEYRREWVERKRMKHEREHVKGSTVSVAIKGGKEYRRENLLTGCRLLRSCSCVLMKRMKHEREHGRKSKVSVGNRVRVKVYPGECIFF